MRFLTSNDVTEHDVPPRTGWTRIAATYPRAVATVVVLMLAVCSVIALP